MIRSVLGYCLKNKLTKWLNKRREEVQAEFALKEKDLINEFNERYLSIQSSLDNRQKELEARLEVLQKEKKDLEDTETRVRDREKELARANDELKAQIRLIEAKARPDQVWESAFSAGFSKAWDMMLPLMTKGIENVKDKIRQQEIEASFPRIDLVVNQRLKELGNVELIEANDVENKRKDFESKLSSSSNANEKLKYQHYLDVINWFLGGRNGN